MTGQMLPRPTPLHPSTKRFRLARVVLVAVVAACALAACGRRGPLEMPPDPNAPKTEKTEAPATPSLTPSPLGTPAARRSTGYVIPNRPFVLDPIL